MINDMGASVAKKTLFLSTDRFRRGAGTRWLTQGRSDFAQIFHERGKGLGGGSLGAMATTTK